MIKLLEEGGKLGGLIIINLECDLLGDLRQLFHITKDVLKVRLDLAIFLLKLLDHRELIAGTKAVLQE